MGDENVDGLSNDAVRALLKRSTSMLTAIPPSAAKRTQRLLVNLPKILFSVEFVLKLPHTTVATVTTNPSNLTTPSTSTATDRVVEKE